MPDQNLSCAMHLCIWKQHVDGWRFGTGLCTRRGLQWRMGTEGRWMPSPSQCRGRHTGRPSAAPQPPQSFPAPKHTVSVRATGGVGPTTASTTRAAMSTGGWRTTCCCALLQQAQRPNLASTASIWRAGYAGGISRKPLEASKQKECRTSIPKHFSLGSLRKRQAFCTKTAFFFQESRQSCETRLCRCSWFHLFVTTLLCRQPEERVAANAGGSPRPNSGQQRDSQTSAYSCGVHFRCQTNAWHAKMPSAHGYPTPRASWSKCTPGT